MKQEISIHHQNKAKEIVDTMFDKNVFNQKFSRDDLQKVEDLIAFYIHMEHESAKRALEVKFMLSRTIPKEHQSPEMKKFTNEREEDEKRKSEQNEVEVDKTHDICKHESGWSLTIYPNWDIQSICSKCWELFTTPANK